MREDKLSKFGITPEQKPLGEGAQKTIFQDPKHSNRVLALEYDHLGKIARKRTEPLNEAQYEVKTRFYMAKIAHLLFPDNMPDTYFSYSEPNIASRQKVSLGHEHSVIEEENMYREISTPESNKKYEAALKRLEQNPNVERLRRELWDAGISFDDNTVNFAVDEKGIPKYVDSIYLNDILKLRTAIIKKLQGKDQKRALVLSERLEKLTAEKNSIFP